MNKSKKPYNYIKLIADDGSGWMLRRDYLVATNFIPNPNKHQFVKHKDGDTLNCAVDNLEWVEKRPRGDTAASQFEDVHNEFAVDADVHPVGYNLTVNMKRGHKIARDSGK